MMGSFFLTFSREHQLPIHCLQLKSAHFSRTSSLKLSMSTKHSRHPEAREGQHEHLWRRWWECRRLSVSVTEPSAYPFCSGSLEIGSAGCVSTASPLFTECRLAISAVAAAPSMADISMLLPSTEGIEPNHKSDMTTTMKILSLTSDTCTPQLSCGPLAT